MPETRCECGATDHPGPHWRHMDALWHEKNRELLRRAEVSLAGGNELDAYFALLAFGREEERRLAEKSAHLRQTDAAPQPVDLRGVA
jgi:hypothetical protein